MLQLELDPVDRSELGTGAVEVLATDDDVELRLTLRSPFGPMACTTTLQLASDGRPQFGEVLLAGRRPTRTRSTSSIMSTTGLGTLDPLTGHSNG
jgi:hypothetical protein